MLRRRKIEPLKKAIRDAYEKIFRDNPVTPESQKEDTVKLDSTNTKDIITKDGSATIPIAPDKLSTSNDQTQPGDQGGRRTGAKAIGRFS